MVEINEILRQIRRIVDEGRSVVQHGETVRVSMLLADAAPISNLVAARDAALEDRRERLHNSHLRGAGAGGME